jgi:hypothetical protein
MNWLSSIRRRISRSQAITTVLFSFLAVASKRQYQQSKAWITKRLAKRCSAPLAAVMTSSQHVYEIRPRKDKRGVDLISDAVGPLGSIVMKAVRICPVRRHLILV